MKIAICSSMSFALEYSKIADELRKFGHEVLVPLGTDEFIAWTRTNDRNESEEAMEYGRIEQLEFFEKMKWYDCVLVANYDKNWISWYIGWSVLIEMWVAFYMRKPIFLLNQIPNESSLRYVQEIQLMKPTIIYWNLNSIKL